MRKFLLSSTHYSGDVVVVYGEACFLVSVDVSGTDMSESQAKGVFRGFPHVLTEFFAFCENKGVNCIEASITIDFDQWWNKYGLKLNRKRCLPVWNKFSQLKQVEVYYNTIDYLEFLDVQSWRSKADPESYLKKSMYETDWKLALKEAKSKR